jgi:16S rRNA (cytosine967-C5)-methyltransferase
VARRHPDIKWLRRETDIGAFATSQQRILDALWRTLAPGGKILYCTCSIFPQENGAQVAAFVGRHADAVRVDIDGQSELQLTPDPEQDGFYYALLQKAV